MALRPIQARAECAATPAVVTSTRIVPWHPPSTVPLDGSQRTAKSARSQSGRSRAIRLRPLASASTSSLS
jgi:hypothetical protein